MNMIERLVRPNIRTLEPYSSARKEFSGRGRIFLDANENPFGSPIPGAHNRYPDPLQTGLKDLIAARFGVAPESIFVGNGSDEAIDLLFRVFCEPRTDNVIICPPTYGMYEVSAAINDVSVRRASLTARFGLDREAIADATDDRSKLLFICSPNNPTGNAFDPDEIARIASDFGGIVVVDEAYGEFSDRGSMITRLADHENVVVLRTFSKAWGLAALRVGFAVAGAGIVGLLNNIKPPYNVSGIAQDAIIDAFRNEVRVAESVAMTIAGRDRLAADLSRLRSVERVFPSDANFLLVRIGDADGAYRFLLSRGIVVRNRNNVELCEGCLRITIGDDHENDAVLAALKDFESL